MFLSGTQQLTLQDAEGLKSHVWSSVRKGATICTIAFVCVPQQAYSDPPSSFFTDIRAGKRPSESTWVSGAPQLADLTLQASFQKSTRKGDRPSQSEWASGAPQLADFTQQAAFQKALVKSGMLPVSSYKFGLHADSIYEAENNKSSLFPPVAQPSKPKPRFVIGGPQADPSQIAADLSAPAVSTVSPVPAAEYSWGSHAQALHAAEAVKSDFFPVSTAPPVLRLGAFLAGAPQLVDLTLQPVFQESLVAGARPTASPTVIGGPLPVDLTQQADIAPSWFATQQGRVPPTTLGTPQADPTQLAAQLVAPAGPAVGGVPAVEYSHGTHATALSAAEAAKSKVFASARATVVASPVSTFVVGTPPQQDLTLQAQFDSPGLLQGPVPPIAVGVPQPDPTQVVALLWQSGITPQGSAAGAEYTWGLHAAALDLAESIKSQFFATARTPPVSANKVGAFVAGAPVDPSQIAASIWQPFTVPQVGSAASGEYVWGTHAATLDYAEAVKSRFFPVVRTPTVASQVVKFVSGAPQADSTQPPAEFFVPGLPQATVSPFMAGVAEVVDVVAQASFSIPVIPPPVGPVFGKFVQGAPQVVDLTLQASFSTSLILVPPATGRVPPFEFAWDLHAAQLAAAEGAKSHIYQAIAIGGVAPSAEPPSLGGSKARKKIRGPYSDPAIYEAYIARCIAEREKPRVNVETALIKEALVHEVEVRHQTNYAEYDALIRENQLLERLVKRETPKYVKAIAARQRQIDRQVKELEENEISSIIIFLDDM